jgi:hypothetical protein
LLPITCQLNECSAIRNAGGSKRNYTDRESVFASFSSWPTAKIRFRTALKRSANPPDSRSPTDARSTSASPANPTMNKNASTKCSASTGNPPSQPEKPKSLREEIVVPLERPPSSLSELKI